VFFDVLEKPLQGLNILCVGIVSTRKNQELLVRACAVLNRSGRPFQCRVVGKFSPGYDDKIKSLVQELGLASRVEITGPVSREELFASYDWATAVVLPSREETSPLSLIQGLAARRAVFGANAAGIPRLLDDGTLGTLFDGENPDSLAARLTEYLDNPEPFREKARIGRLEAEKSFHPVGVARQTIETYRRILAGA
jgi:1,4-alpha-glucan branching enzyme